MAICRWLPQVSGSRPGMGNRAGLRHGRQRPGVPDDPPDAVYLAHSTLRSTASGRLQPTASGRRWALVWAGIYTDPSTPRSWQSAG